VGLSAVGLVLVGLRAGLVLLELRAGLVLVVISCWWGCGWAGLSEWLGSCWRA